MREAHNGFNRFSQRRRSKPLKRLCLPALVHTGLKPGANERLQESEMRPDAPKGAANRISSHCNRGRVGPNGSVSHPGRPGGMASLPNGITIVTQVARNDSDEFCHAARLIRQPGKPALYGRRGCSPPLLARNRDRARRRIGLSAAQQRRIVRPSCAGSSIG